MPACPLVSVIIPTYNRAPLLAQALTSVFGQSFRDFEVIVADDGSEDETPKTVESFSGVRYIRLEHGGMPGRSRNRGVAAARGRFIAFLDSDDLWLSEKLEKQIRLFEASFGKEPCRICHTRELWLRAGGEVSQAGQRHRREGDIFADSLKKCVIGPSTVMVEKVFFERHGGFREDLEIAEDYELWLRMTFGENAAYLDEALTIKRAALVNDGAGQLSQKYGHIEVFRIRALQGLVEGAAFTLEPERDALARAELGRKCAIYALGCRKRGRTEEAQMYEELALRARGAAPPEISYEKHEQDHEKSGER
ncbi:MAG: glycosyltransferase family 2 protein [Spirochaetales bacterium]|jgi:glycosyltransferase involved in cell wall biosynthesis|nr:glycosyltransferase family 2 protein [Spirochaetales bacterium]